MIPIEQDPWMYATESIRNSIGEEKSNGYATQWEKADDTYAFIIRKTFQRPRDVIQFCICMKNNMHKEIFTKGDFKKAIKCYYDFVWTDICNELVNSSVDSVLVKRFIQYLGKSSYKYKELESIFSSMNNNKELTYSIFINTLLVMGLLKLNDRPWHSFTEVRNFVVLDNNSTIKVNELLHEITN
jgi:hypothetical protein